MLVNAWESVSVPCLAQCLTAAQVTGVIVLVIAVKGRTTLGVFVTIIRNGSDSVLVFNFL